MGASPFTEQPLALLRERHSMLRRTALLETVAASGRGRRSSPAPQVGAPAVIQFRLGILIYGGWEFR